MAITKENAKDFLPFIKALSEGKKIEYKDYKDEWSVLEELKFSNDPSNYRIKPEPKYRPFKSVEECWEEMQKHQSFGWIKNKNTNKLYNILTIYDDEDTIKISTEDFVLMPFAALESFIFADGTPFGIKEKE